jgi:hypothetical protein
VAVCCHSQNAHVLRLVESTSSIRTESRVQKQNVEQKKEETTRMRIRPKGKQTIYWRKRNHAHQRGQRLSKPKFMASARRFSACITLASHCLGATAYPAKDSNLERSGSPAIGIETMSGSLYFESKALSGSVLTAFAVCFDEAYFEDPDGRLIAAEQLRWTFHLLEPVEGRRKRQPKISCEACCEEDKRRQGWARQEMSPTIGYQLGRLGGDRDLWAESIGI